MNPTPQSRSFNGCLACGRVFSDTKPGGDSVLKIGPGGHYGVGQNAAHLRLFGGFDRPRTSNRGRALVEQEGSRLAKTDRSSEGSPGRLDVEPSRSGRHEAKVHAGDHLVRRGIVNAGGVEDDQGKA